jgi:hypothetical protein
MEILNKSGLEVNYAKCASLFIDVDRKKKKWFISSQPTTIQGIPIPVIDWSNSYKYLDINMGGIRKETKVNDAFKPGSAFHLICSAQAPAEMIHPQTSHHTSKNTHPHIRHRQQSLS